MTSFAILSANVVVGNDSFSTHSFKSLSSNTLTIGPRDIVNGTVAFLANVGIRTIEPSSALHVAGSVIVDDDITTQTLNASTSATAGTFNGSGAGLTNLNASNLTSGTLQNARISGTYTGFTDITASGSVSAATINGSLSASQLTSGTLQNARISGAYTGFTDITASGSVSAATINGNFSASQLSSGTIQNARITGAYTGFTNITASGSVSAATINGSLSASQLSSGTVPDARMTGAYTGITNLTASGSVSASNIVANYISRSLPTISGASGVVTHNFSLGSVWYHTLPAADFTIALINVPTTAAARVYEIILVVAQETTPYMPTALSINGSDKEIQWKSSIVPIGAANGIDTVTFKLLWLAGTWVVVGY
jgi:hypothetical protein